MTILWNANNTFAFERIDWPRLAQAAIITTVSHYMKHLMWDLGVNPLVIPDGLAAEVFVPLARGAVAQVLPSQESSRDSLSATAARRGGVA